LKSLIKKKQLINTEPKARPGSSMACIIINGTPQRAMAIVDAMHQIMAHMQMQPSARLRPYTMVEMEPTKKRKRIEVENPYQGLQLLAFTTEAIRMHHRLAIKMLGYLGVRDEIIMLDSISKTFVRRKWHGRAVPTTLFQASHGEPAIPVRERIEACDSILRDFNYERKALVRRWVDIHCS
jgi:hypothetical protein